MDFETAAVFRQPLAHAAQAAAFLPFGCIGRAIIQDVECNCQTMLAEMNIDLLRVGVFQGIAQALAQGAFEQEFLPGAQQLLRLFDVRMPGQSTLAASQRLVVSARQSANASANGAG